MKKWKILFLPSGEISEFGSEISKMKIPKFNSEYGYYTLPDTEKEKLKPKTDKLIEIYDMYDIFEGDILVLKYYKTKSYKYYKVIEVYHSKLYLRPVKKINNKWVNKYDDADNYDFKVSDGWIFSDEHSIHKLSK